MKTSLILFAGFLLTAPVFADAPAGGGESKVIAFDQLGAEAQKQYAGDGIGITPTAEGAILRAQFQRLEGRATPEGLWLTSTAEEDAGKDASFRVRAIALGSADTPVRLSPTGEVRATQEAAAWLRPHLIEEYSTSIDGIRQDFVVPLRPPGTGALTVTLELSGVRAEAAPYGAKLIVEGTARELAYNRLHVTDATGRELTAHMEVRDAGTLTIRVNDRGAAYPVRIDPTFSDADWVSIGGGVPGADSDVFAVAVDVSGDLYAGGRFSVVGNVTANRVAKWNGSAWSTLGSGTNNDVLALALDGSGNLYAGGQFSSAGGTAANFVAKWNGSAWSALGSGTSGTVRALALDGSGNLYAGGWFSIAGETATSNVAKWNGSAWSALGSGTNDTVYALALDGSDNLYAGGEFTTAGGTAANYVAKWNGSAWSALGGGVQYGLVYALALDGSGNLFAGGWFDTAGGRNVAKWNGSAWSALGSGTNGNVYALTLDSSGNLYAGGDFTTAGATAANRIAKWNGSAWSTLGSGMGGFVYALALDGSGNLYVGGWISTAGGTAVSDVAKWNGSAWSALGSGTNDWVSALALDRSGNLYAGGGFTTARGTVANHIAKWNGSAWSGLGSGINGGVYALALDGSGNLYAGGSFTTAGRTATSNVAKWNGSAWSTLGSGTNGLVNTLAVDGAGNLYAGGGFTTAGGTVTNRVAKWNGTAWGALGGGTNDYVNDLALDGSGNLFAGGGFTTAGETSANYVAKWDGSTWSALGSGTDDNVIALALDGSGNLYVGGYFTTAGETSASNVAKWNGSAWSALGSGTNGSVSALAQDGSGNLYAGGGFTTAGGTAASKVAKWNGSAWSALGSGTNGSVSALALDGVGNLYAGGSFTTAGGKVSAYISRINKAESEIAVSGNGVEIANGDVTPTTANDTDFGIVTVMGGRSRTFTIANSGDGTLNLLGTVPNYVTLSGPGATAFTVLAQPASGRVAQGGSTQSFVINFNPPALGTFAATVSIPNDDADENPFTFNVQGTGDFPKIAVSGNGIDIASGDEFPKVAVHTDFGSVTMLNAQRSRIFTIRNEGTATLLLSGTPSVAISGPAASDFKVTAHPEGSMAAGSSTTAFSVTFDPTLPGPRHATVTINCNDPFFPAFTFDIAGFGALATPRAQTITFAPPASVYVSQSPLTLNAFASSGLPVTLNVVAGPATLDGIALTLAGPGTVKLSANQPGADNYNAAAAVTRTIVVKPDPTSLNLINLNQTYDSQPKPIAAVGAVPVTITYQFGGVEGTTPPTDAGNYRVKAVSGRVTKTGTLVIAKAPLTVTPGDLRKFVGEANPDLTRTITGFFGSNTEAVLTKLPVLTTRATANSPGGQYSITASGAAAANYSFIYRQGTLVVESFAGNYEALLTDATLLPVAKLAVTVTQSRRGVGFSANLNTAAESSAVAFKGSLITDSANERATGTASATTKFGTVYAINFTLPLYGDATMSATREAVALGSAANGKKLPILKKVAYAGAHTAILRPATPASGTVPAGAGWATATVASNGTLTLGGRLADGTKFTASVAPDGADDPGYRLFVQPYWPGRIGTFVAGEFNLESHPDLDNRRYLESATLNWRKDERVQDSSYRAGFGPVSTNLGIDPWLPALAATKTAPAITLAQRLGLTAPTNPFSVQHTFTGSESNGYLPTALSLGAKDAVSVTAPVTTPLNISKWKATFVAKTGTFTGSFELIDAGNKRTVPFSGVLRQSPSTSSDAVIGDGHYLLPSLPGAESTESVSGEVLFQTP